MKDSKEVLNIKKEYELLSTFGKKLWEDVLENINEIVQEMNLDREQKDALLQRYMAEIRYHDLEATNKYLAKTGEQNSKKAIMRNKITMERMNEVYLDNYPPVKDIYKKVDNLMKKKQAQKDKEQKRKN